MYWTIICQPTVCVHQNIFEKTQIEIGSYHLHASFGTFSVEIDELLEAQWVFEHSKEFEIGEIFFQKRRFVYIQTYFKGSFCFE